MEPELLNSWKEIAAYLGRGLRTVARWEKDEGLPVHRQRHSRQSSVYAFKHEIDQWRRSREMVTEAPSRRRRPRALLLAACALGLIAAAWIVSGRRVILLVPGSASRAEVVKQVDESIAATEKKGGGPAVRVR